ncbi:MAG: MBL fold metallo-hydrolase [Pseudopedobacter saltans]|uniref:MBL fold metallo-hydrolase n=1 Tax=Pseudopedobacter saltans TaxID=151895 RepID=A0A2W5ETG1_9SPHI|nr:MAG: MBL fold metallo-hydrolase [Pseudopedobacter saltans]
MYVEQIYTSCLSEASYYVESNGEVAIIDPMRDIEMYLKMAKERNATIKYIFETHFHADFVSGHIDLSKATGAPIIYGPEAKPTFKVTIAKDKEVFPLGKASFEVLHTPGHTLESTCYLLKDEDGKPNALFTGDTLFIGDVGRPDLAQGSSLYTTTDLAGILYDSIQEKIMSLPDDVIVYPAHGAGSSCGKNLSSETQSTIKEQKESNYALQAKSRGEFITLVTDGLNAPPAYFPINAEINKKGYANLDDILTKGMKAFSVTDFKEKIKDKDIIILDTRPQEIFTEGFVPGSIFIGLDGRFAEWAGSLLPFDKPIILVTEPGNEKETIIRLARVGFDKIEGYLDGGYDAWKNAGERSDLIISIPAEELAMDYHFDEDIIIVDVRNEREYGDQHVKRAVNFPLNKLVDPAAYLSDIDDMFNLYIHCAGGYRSVIASSIIKRQGFHNLRNVLGGISAIKSSTDIPLESSKEVVN